MLISSKSHHTVAMKMPFFRSETDKSTFCFNWIEALDCSMWLIMWYTISCVRKSDNSGNVIFGQNQINLSFPLSYLNFVIYFSTFSPDSLLIGPLSANVIFFALEKTHFPCNLIQWIYLVLHESSPLLFYFANVLWRERTRVLHIQRSSITSIGFGRVS